MLGCIASFLDSTESRRLYKSSYCTLHYFVMNSEAHIANIHRYKVSLMKQISLNTEQFRLPKRHFNIEVEKEG